MVTFAPACRSLSSAIGTSCALQDDTASATIWTSSPRSKPVDSKQHQFLIGLIKMNLGKQSNAVCKTQTWLLKERIARAGIQQMTDVYACVLTSIPKIATLTTPFFDRLSETSGINMENKVLPRGRPSGCSSVGSSASPSSDTVLPRAC